MSDSTLRSEYLPRCASGMDLVQAPRRPRIPTVFRAVKIAHSLAACRSRAVAHHSWPPFSFAARYSRTAIPAGAISVFIASLVACSWPPPSPPPNSTAVSVTASQASGGAVTCTGSLMWKYHLQQAESGIGATTDIVQPRSYDLPAIDGVCAYSDAQPELRPGYWQVTVANIQCNRVHLTPIVGNHNLRMNNCALDFTPAAMAMGAGRGRSS
jgi:hypothetical protein